MGFGKEEMMLNELKLMINKSDIINEYEFTYKSLIFTYTCDKNVNIDYYVIIGYENTELYEQNKTIILQMEPWVYDDTKNWGVRTWGYWSIPDETKFLHVHRHVKYLNPAQWFFNTHNSINNKINFNRKDKVIAIIGEKCIDTGHKNRIEFIKYVESLNYNIIDIYGRQNYHNFKNYKGTIENSNKGNLIQQYKYILSVENNKELNYATEKIWEAFITETLSFYDGCPNLFKYVDKKSYIEIDLNNQAKSLDIILSSIENNEWNNRLHNILSAKYNTIYKYNIFEVIYNIIQNDK